MFYLEPFYRLGFKIPSVKAEAFEDAKALRYGAKPLVDDIAAQCKSLLNIYKTIPSLAVILVGDDPASHVYVSAKERFFQKLGFHTRSFKYAHADRAELLDLISRLNHDSSVHGILIQLPLPKYLNETEILESLDPKKDVDGFHPVNMGLVMLNDFRARVPCTPLGIMLLLHAHAVSLEGINALVVGRSRIVGKPMAQLLLAAHASVTQVHSRSQNIKMHLDHTDVCIVAAGVKDCILPHDFASRTTVIDVGIHRVNEKIRGDVDASVRHHVLAVTPVPGGVGPMTIACLALNTALAAWS